MTTLLITHPASLDHETPCGHPERADRIRAIEAALEAERFSSLHRITAPCALPSDIKLAHDASYVDTLIEQSPQQGEVRIDFDTVMSPGTLEAALRAAGAAILAVDEVLEGTATNAFCALRPPGHHAERDRAMGFCFFNTAAIAARHGLERRGLAKVAIVDWDVHHGNGTQDIVWDDPRCLYASTHEMPLYPGTGEASEQGAHGQILNVPLRAGDGSDEFRAAFDEILLPCLKTFTPEMIVISAGFDAHWRDPLGNLNLVEADFAWATRRLMALTPRIVSVLEGGYDLEGLARSAAAHVSALMGMD